MFVDENGQASVELLFITLVVIILIVSFTSIIGNEQNQTSTGTIGQARMTGEMAAETINTVYTNGAGYSVNLTIPSNMTLHVYSGYVTVNLLSTGQNVNVSFIPLNIKNFSNPGSPVILNAGTHIVNNTNNGSSYFITFN
ncbi:MAG: hypothetical protein ACLPWD_05375 [Methanobacterium sp.]